MREYPDLPVLEPMPPATATDHINAVAKWIETGPAVDMLAAGYHADLIALAFLAMALRHACITRQHEPPESVQRWLVGFSNPGTIAMCQAQLAAMTRTGQPIAGPPAGVQ